MTMTREDFLSLVPHLAEIPDEWEGQHFYVVDIDRGRILVLADDIDEAERAILAYFGRIARPVFVRDMEGQPMTREFPYHTLSGPAQYLDATLCLHGDPVDPPWRSPDSSPALSTGAAFVLDGWGPRWREDRRNPEMIAAIEGEESRRDEYLRRHDLLTEIVGSEPT